MCDVLINFMLVVGVMIFLSHEIGQKKQVNSYKMTFVYILIFVWIFKYYITFPEE